MIGGGKSLGTRNERSYGTIPVDPFPLFLWNEVGQLLEKTQGRANATGATRGIWETKKEKDRVKEAKNRCDFFSCGDRC